MKRGKALAALAAGELVLLVVVLVWKRLDGLDLDVYRLGTAAFFRTGDPYGVLPPTHDGTVLPFTYPPFAALAFVPLLAVPARVSLIALTVVSVLALGAALAWCFARFDRRPHVVGVAVFAAQAVALFSEPVRSTLGFGQINLLLMLLVVFDVLGPIQQRGYLVGLAGAVKLTPLAFVLFFLVRKDFRSAARAVGAFVVAEAVAWVLAPRGSVRYWTSVVYSGDRIGDPAYIGNQSLRGVLERLGVGGAWWAVAVVLTLALTAFAIHRARHAVPALLVCALGALLVSPISWTHHWVWLAPAIGVLCRQGRWWAAVPATIVLVVSPVWDFAFWPLRESYVLTGLAVLLLLAQPLDHVLDRRDQSRDVVGFDRREGADA